MSEPVLVDVERFRLLAKGAARRLDCLPPLDPDVDRITLGRVSGVHLALAYLDECVVKE